MEEKYSPEWWARWTQIADGIRFNAERMAEAGNEMESLAREKGWKEAEPGASFLCHLFQLMDTFAEIHSEAHSLEEEFPQYYDAMYECDEEDEA